jgi:hypothetical protein
MTAQPVKKPLVAQVTINQPVDDPKNPVPGANLVVSGTCDSSVTSLNVSIVNPADNIVAASQQNVQPTNGSWSTTLTNVPSTWTDHAWNVVMATGISPSGNYTDMHRVRIA